MRDATIEIIHTVIPHPNADRLDLCKILGYQCVTQKGLYNAGKKIVYVKPDSLLPDNAAWAEGYRKYAPSRVRAVKLRDEVSNGIIVPFEMFSQEVQDKLNELSVGADVSDLINVIHYESPVPQDLSIKGEIPYFISKTDEERHENFGDELPFGEECDFTLKNDGQSCSFYFHLNDVRFGTLGRNAEYKDDAVNNYTLNIERYDIKNKLIEYCKKYNLSLCIRGESYGQGIQSAEINPHSKMEKGWAMFNVWDIDKCRYYFKGEQHYYVNVAAEIGLPTVTLLETAILTPELIQKYSKLLTKIDGKPFEGVVVKHRKGSFKIINEYYDSKK